MLGKKYRIKNLESEIVNPEETLADNLSSHSGLEIPISNGVFRFVYILAVVFFVLLFTKSFQLQFLYGDKFQLGARKATMTLYSLRALRGVIFDSKNRPLVANSPTFDLLAVHSMLPRTEAELDKLFSSLEKILNTPKPILAQLFGENGNSAAFTIKTSLSKEQMAKVKAEGLEGVYIVDVFQRSYLFGQITGGIIGYTTKVNPEDLKNDDYYFLTDRTGRLGLESSFEKFLRGEHRELDLRSGTESLQKARPGNDVVLYLDIDVQKRLFQTLNSVLISAGLKRGAAVMQNLKTGAVLGLVSLPSFDPNIFAGASDQEGMAKITKVLNDKNRPLFNRVISGRYSPGSTIKPLLALAGLREGVVDSQTVIYAEGGITVPSVYDPSTTYTFRDWKVHGWTDIRKAIANSVNVFFYALGGGYENIKGLGIDKIEDYLRNFGADKKLGIDLPGEIIGFLPSPEWKEKEKKENWFVGDTYNISIGQGDLLVTPLWLNAYTSALVNGGLLMKPLLVKEIRDPEGAIIKNYPAEVLKEVPYDYKYNLIVKEGMRQTVESGTGKILNDLPVKVGAKTGTAQIANENLNSLLIVFGPYDEPDIALTILIEDVKSQGLALEVARNFLLWYFSAANYPQE